MRIYVLPTAEDQMHFSQGKLPGNLFVNDFASKAEADAYQSGIVTLEDCAEHEIVRETDLTVTIEVDDGGAEDMSFLTVAEKDSFKHGLQDGDGWTRPMVIREDEDQADFEKIDGLYRAAAGLGPSAPGA